MSISILSWVCHEYIRQNSARAGNLTNPASSKRVGSRAPKSRAPARELWRKRVGVEPTRAGVDPTHTGFEVEAVARRLSRAPKSRAQRGNSGGSVSESNRPEPGLTRLTPVLKTGMITGPHALPRPILRRPIYGDRPLIRKRPPWIVQHHHRRQRIASRFCDGGQDPEL